MIPRDNYERLILEDQASLNRLAGILEGLHCAEAKILRSLLDPLLKNNKKLRDDFYQNKI
jgi:hypothetical protein